MQQFKLSSTGHLIPVKVNSPQSGDDPSAPPPADRPLATMPVGPAPEPPAEGRANSDTPAGINGEAAAHQLQAEMENFRRRQQRRADETIDAEKERLLRQFLPLADNLRRALDQNTENVEALREGIELTLRQLEQTLAAEGVTRMETVGHPFDPTWHEAVATVAANTPPNTVVNEVEAGYKINHKLLRPAKLIVAE